MLNIFINPEVSIGKFMQFGKVGDTFKFNNAVHTVYYIDSTCVLCGRDGKEGRKYHWDNKSAVIELLDYKLTITRGIIKK